MVRDVSGILTNVGSAVTGLATGNIVGAGLSALGVAGSGVSALGNTINSKIAKMSSTGTVGSLDYTGFGSWAVLQTFKLQVDQDPSDLGRPLCQTTTINELSGYVLVDNPHVSIAGLPEEKSAIEGFMASGFFYE